MDLFEDIYNQTEKAVKKDAELYEVQEQLKGRIKQKVKTEVIQEWLTLDNIYKYASDDELRAIVSSIHLRLGFHYKQIMDKYSIEGYELTDKEINKVAKGLRVND